MSARSNPFRTAAMAKHAISLSPVPCIDPMASMTEKATVVAADVVRCFSRR